jgi:DNA-binding NtrC family response regulator
MQENVRDSRPNVLIVDDEEGAREALELICEDYYDTELAKDGLFALELIQKRPFDVVLLDVRMPRLDGIETLKRIRAHDKSIGVVMVSAANLAQEATSSMKYGAFDYITKPYEPEQILLAVEGALKERSLERPIRRPTSSEVFKVGDVQIISRSSAMHDLFADIEKIASIGSNVLITGESGTGKELFARAIHAASHRSKKAFIAVNCGAIPLELMESELFGHEKGAFTSAFARSCGKFELANGGTLFLDEISSLPLSSQAKLLRVLQEREFMRVGGHQTLKTDARVIAATNTRIEDLVERGEFRNDLYFRLKVIPFELPPLRRREGDIPLLSNYFLAKLNRHFKKQVPGLSPDAMRILETYPWRGNVRELENLIERLVAMGADGRWIGAGDLPSDLFMHEKQELPKDVEIDLGLNQARDAFERDYILRALEQCAWKPVKAARLLKIHRNSLASKMKVLKIESDAQHQN